jgi:exopolysaccharide biosynthesis predicted pyruvyltransferase EpsI
MVTWVCNATVFIQWGICLLTYPSETENKGDAAIYTAQQMVLASMGITTMEACRFAEGSGCNGTAYRKALEDHKPYSAIMMAGGGNFNDFYWEDQPARIKTAAAYKDFPIRSFPQSIHMTKPEKIQQTYDSFSAHPDIQLAARDQPSYDWLQKQFGKTKVRHVLSPDVAFAWGDRSDIRKNIKKKYDVLILARDDWEITHSSKDVATGVGELDLGGEIGKVSYRKVDWKKTPTPLIDGVDENGNKLPGKAGEKEEGKEQRAFAKAMNGFEMLAEARLVITDRLHGEFALW